MTPNVPRARSVGRMWLRSADPDVKPALDFRYLPTRTGTTSAPSSKACGSPARWRPPPVQRLAAARGGAGSGRSLGRRAVQYGRRAAHTVYHPARDLPDGRRGRSHGGARSPAAAAWPRRAADRGRVQIFPTMPTVNPMVTVLLAANARRTSSPPGRPHGRQPWKGRPDDDSRNAGRPLGRRPRAEGIGFRKDMGPWANFALSCIVPLPGGEHLHALRRHSPTADHR